MHFSEHINAARLDKGGKQPEFLKMLKQLPSNPTILLGIHAREMKISKHLYMNVKSRKKWEQPKCPSGAEWINDREYPYIECYSAIKRN